MKCEMPFCSAVSRREPLDDPDSDRHGTHVRHRFRDDFDSVGKSGRQDVALVRERWRDDAFWMDDNVVNLLHLYHFYLSPGHAEGLPAARVKLKKMPQALVGMELSELRQVLPADQPAYRAAAGLSCNLPPEGGRSGSDFHACPRTFATNWPHTPSSDLPELDRRYESVDGTRRYLLAAERRAHGRDGPDAGRRPRHGLHFEPGRLPGGLQVLHDGADGSRTFADRRRDRRPGAVRRARQRSARRPKSSASTSS